jgi:outer membrane lipoprotein-sorting protein
MDTLPQRPKRYSAKVVRSDGEPVCFVYADGPKGRLETYSADGRTKVVISRPDKGVVWTLTPETRSYSQAKFTEDMVKKATRFIESTYEWKADGTEVIEGRRCLRFLGSYPPETGPPGSAHEVQYFDARTQMPRRFVTFDSNGKEALTVDYLDVVLRPPPSELFEIPTGYKRAYRRRTR